MPKGLLKISEFAALSGISRKLLIFYDNNDILHPHMIDSMNGYRYYSYRQIDTASVIVSLRKTGMSLDSIREYLARRSPENLIQTLEAQEQVLEQQIIRLEQIKGMIQDRTRKTRRGMEEEVGAIRVECQPEENLFLGPQLPKEYDLDAGWTFLPEFFSECQKENIQLGFIIGTMVTKANLLSGVWKTPDHYFYQLPKGLYPEYTIKPQGRYVVGTEYADFGQTACLYHKLLYYIEENQLKISGNAYEEYLIDEIAEADPSHYKLQIAIQISD